MANVPTKPPVDFSTLILSIATSAGESFESAVAGGSEAASALALGQHSVELLALLEEKTVGNLSGEEERLLAQLLFDLRVKLVELTQKC